MAAAAAASVASQKTIISGSGIRIHQLLAIETFRRDLIILRRFLDQPAAEMKNVSIPSDCDRSESGPTNSLKNGPTISLDPFLKLSFAPEAENSNLESRKPDCQIAQKSQAVSVCWHCFLNSYTR